MTSLRQVRMGVDISAASSQVPYLHYCIEVWGNTFKSYTEPLLKLQKRALRIITGSTRYSHTAVMFSQFNLLKFKQIYYLSVQMFMYKYYHNVLPDIFSDLFTLKSEIHSHETRQRRHYHPPVSRLIQTGKNIRYVGVKSHAKWSLYLSYCCSPHSYKKAAKYALLTQENWSLDT